jgi:hypothetical protein
MKKTNCKTCGNKTSDSGIRTGYCVNCAEKRLTSVSRALIIGTAVGVVLASAFFWIIYYIQVNSDGTFYGTETGFRVYYFFVTMDIQKLAIICIVLFALPFGIGTDARLLPNINTGYEEGNGFLIVVKWAICTLLAPVIIAYMLIACFRLKSYVALNKEGE